jgi:transcriptional regulator with XRE-family HTH domain
MKTTEYMTAIKARHNISSDYALAKLLGVTQQAVSKWRNGKATIGDELAPLVGHLLDIDAAKVLADVNAEREHDETMKALWQRMASAFATVACVGTLITLPGEPQASTYHNINSRPKKRKHATCFA